MTEIKYTIQSGVLPSGVTLDEDTGTLVGDIDHANVGLGPQWIGPAAGSLGAYDEEQTLSITLNARLDNGDLAKMGIVNNGKDYLPWGLKFEPSTGVLSGTIADLLPSQVSLADNRDGPVWQTQFGKLADFDVGASATLEIAASGKNNKTVRNYSIVKDGLPWGLKLNGATGEITGTVAELKNPGMTIEVPKLPAPVWNTPTGSIGVVGEFDDFTFQFQATPAPERSMTKYTIRGSGLPWGLKLNFSTGQITGRLAETRTVREAGYYDVSKNPSIGSTIVINGSPTEVTSSLGTVAKGQTFSAQLVATPVADRTISRWAMKSGTLPFGIKLSRSGLISGTVSTANHVVAKTHEFTVEVYDNQTNWVDRTFTINVQ